MHVTISNILVLIPWDQLVFTNIDLLKIFKLVKFILATFRASTLISVPIPAELGNSFNKLANITPDPVPISKIFIFLFLFGIFFKTFSISSSVSGLGINTLLLI